MRGRVVALGKFDALHRGHRALVARAAELGAPALLGFAGMAQVLGWAERLPLCDAAEEASVLAAWSRELGRVVSAHQLDFAAVRGLAPAAFVALLREEHGIAGVVTGTDFRFGRDRSGDAQELARLCAARGLACAAVPPVRDTTGAVISSSGLREALARGELDRVADWLGRPYVLRGRVARGDGRGRTLGFPTANVTGYGRQPPGSGVYAALALLQDGREHPAVVNIGTQPSIGPGRPLAVEVHLPDWSGDLYGQSLIVCFRRRLRAEQRFPDLAALRAQITADVAEARR